MSSAVASATAVTRPSFSSIRHALPPLTKQRYDEFLSDIRVPAPSFLGTNLPPTATLPSTAGLSDNLRLSNCNLVRALNPVLSSHSMQQLSTAQNLSNSVLPEFAVPLAVVSSVPPVPAELVYLISQNSYTDFKFLLPTNLSVISSLPSISLQSLAHLPAFKLTPINSFRDYAAVWGVFASIMEKIHPIHLPELIQYFVIIAESANKPDVDWIKYDTLFRQSEVVFAEKGWGEPDPTVWLQCYKSGQPGHFYESNRSPLGPRIYLCYNHNRDTCSFRDCKFAHRCMSCKGSHPKFKCPNRSNSDSFEEP